MKFELHLVQMNESDPISSEHNLYKCVLNFLRDIKKEKLIKRENSQILKLFLLFQNLLKFLKNIPNLLKFFGKIFPPYSTIQSVLRISTMFHHLVILAKNHIFHHYPRLSTIQSANIPPSSTIFHHFPPFSQIHEEIT